MKIAGLNAPIPPGCQYGYHLGGWGKPPVDDKGNPVYGDPFSTWEPEEDADDEKEVVHWGDIEIGAEEEEVEQEEPEDEEKPTVVEHAVPEVAHVQQTYIPAAPKVVEQIAAPLDRAMPETLELRKEKQQQLFTVLQTQDSSVGGAMFGSAHKYVIPNEGDVCDISLSYSCLSLSLSLSTLRMQRIKAS